MTFVLFFNMFQNVIRMAQDEGTLEGFRRAMHCAILQANDAGAPAGQMLDSAPSGSGQAQASGPSQTPAPIEEEKEERPAKKGTKRVKKKKKKKKSKKGRKTIMIIHLNSLQKRELET